MTKEQLIKINKITERLKSKGDLSKHEFTLIANIINKMPLELPCIICKKITTNVGTKGSPICVDCSH